MTGIRPDERLSIGDHVFGPGFFLASSHFAVHSRLIALKKARLYRWINSRKLRKAAQSSTRRQELAGTGRLYAHCDIRVET